MSDFSRRDVGPGVEVATIGWETSCASACGLSSAIRFEQGFLQESPLENGPMRAHVAQTSLKT